MKKIVGILCAAAMAASVFAADVSVVSRFEGDLFNYANDTVKMLQIEDGAEYWYADFAVATWGEKAGATIVYSNGNGFENAVAKGRMMMYFNPFDGFQIKLGFVETSLHVDHIDWWRTCLYQRVNWYGYTVMYTHGSFGVEASLNPAGGYWFTKDTANNVWLKAWYGTDIGTFGATLNFGANCKTLTALVGYDKGFNGQSLWVDAAVAMNFDADKPVSQFGVTADLSGDVDALHHETYVEFDMNGLNTDDSTPAFTVWGKYSYALDAVTPYVMINTGDILADNVAVTVKPGLTGNLGGMAWDVGVNLTLAKDFAVSVPFSTQINF